MMNLLYLQSSKESTLTGTYGNIVISRTRHGAIVSKYANKSTLDMYYNEYCLGKETAVLWHLKQQRKKLGPARFPLLYSSDHRHISLLNMQMDITTGIHQEYTGPSLMTCHLLGFLVDPRKILSDLMKACNYLKNAGVLHLDIKPNNATLDLDKGLVKLIDFGYSQLTEVACTANTGIQPTEKYLSTGERICIIDSADQANYNFSHAFNTEGQVPVALDSHPFQPAKAYKLQLSVCNVRFRDPTLLCAEALGVSKGLDHDARLDVFASAMTVLSGMNGEPTIYSDEKESAVQNARAMLAFLSMVRGSLSRGEAEVLRSTLMDASVRTARAIEGDSKNYALLQHFIQCSQNLSVGNKALMKYIFGVSFTEALNGITHPVEVLRDSAEECLAKLEEPEQPARPVFATSFCMRERISFASAKCREESCIFRGLLFEHVIVSVVVKGHTMLWNSVLPVFHRLSRQEKLTISFRAARILHNQCCRCNRKKHDILWYMALDRESRFDIQVNGSKDYLKEILAK